MVEDDRGAERRGELLGSGLLIHDGWGGGVQAAPHVVGSQMSTGGVVCE